jgi:hypothetical protein
MISRGENDEPEETGAGVEPASQEKERRTEEAKRPLLRETRAVGGATEQYDARDFGAAFAKDVEANTYGISGRF